MQTWITVLLFLVGLVCIVKGGDWFLNGAVWIAEITGVPRFLIGATVVSLATTLPELTVSVTGVLAGQIDLAVGNAVGSVTANLGLILGLSAMCMPAVVNRRQFDGKAGLMVTGALILLLLCRGNVLPMRHGLLLFAVFAVYLWNNLADAKASRSAETSHPAVSRRQAVGKMLSFAVGIAAILIGSHLLIDCGSALALQLGVPAAIIGVTMVAVGTSLPELVTALTAIAHHETALSVGNIIGANIIDLTLILPICAGVSGGELTIGVQTTALDLPACLLVCGVAVLPPLWKGRFYRWQGIALLAIYAGYLALLFQQA